MTDAEKLALAVEWIEEQGHKFGCRTNTHYTFPCTCGKQDVLDKLKAGD